MTSGIDTLIDLPKEMYTNVCTCSKKLRFNILWYM